MRRGRFQVNKMPLVCLLCGAHLASTASHELPEKERFAWHARHDASIHNFHCSASVRNAAAFSPGAAGVNSWAPPPIPATAARCAHPEARPASSTSERGTTLTPNLIAVAGGVVLSVSVQCGLHTCNGIYVGCHLLWPPSGIAPAVQMSADGHDARDCCCRVPPPRQKDGAGAAARKQGDGDEGEDASQ